MKNDNDKNFSSYCPEKYFGTDGIRGRFGKFPVNEIGFNILAQALEHFNGGLGRIIIGRDPRFSGKAIVDFLVAGFSDTVEIINANIITSPLLSKAVKYTKSDFGLMITASHNSAEDNGVKIFDRFGVKISLKDETEIELLMSKMTNIVKNTEHKVINYQEDEHYIIGDEFFKKFPKVSIDCANGATVKFAKKGYHFTKIEWLGVEPDGYNINVNCGSEHPDLLIKKVRSSGANLGIAHDGDGDRLLLCDGNGAILPGEVILGMIAIYLQRIGLLKEKRIVSTQMSSRGLAKGLEKYGIAVDYSDIGDRNVAAKMREFGCNLGGENSGHVIFTDEAPTSDGIQTALLFFKAISELKISLKEAMDLIPLFPRKICNIGVKRKIPLEQLPDIQNIIPILECSLGLNGKILVRYSGTENKMRLLVEAETEHLADMVMVELKNSIENCEKLF